MSKNLITVKSLKDDVKVYERLEKENANGWEWYCTCALGNLLQDENITLSYIKQMTKEELNVTISLSWSVVNKFKSLDLARAFIDVYKKYYGQGQDEEDFYQNEIQPLIKFIADREKS